MIDNKLVRFSILLIDDQWFLRNTYRQMLYQLGFVTESIHESSHAWEGLAMTEKVKPSFVLCDVHMPVGNGMDYLRALRNHDDVRVATTPVIMLTSDSSTDAVISSKGQGVAGYLVKPVSLTALKRAVERVLKVELTG